MLTLRRLVLMGTMLVSSVASTQSAPISTDGTDPRTWDPKLEATKAAPKNHLVVFENDDIRILSVTVAPGEVEPLHPHLYPSVLIIDKLP